MSMSTSDSSVKSLSSSSLPWDPGLFGGTASPSLASLACCCSRLCFLHLMRLFWNQTLTWSYKKKKFSVWSIGTKCLGYILKIKLFIIVFHNLPVLLWVGEQMLGGSALIPPYTAAVRTPSPVWTAARWWNLCAFALIFQLCVYSESGLLLWPVQHLCVRKVALVRVAYYNIVPLSQ